MGDFMLQAYIEAARMTWLLEPKYYDRLMQVASRQLSDKDAARAARTDKLEKIQAVNARRGVKLDGTTTITVSEGVAIQVIAGPIFPHADSVGDISSPEPANVDRLSADFDTAINDPLVKSILLYFDSPGGAAAGINELAGKIRAARGIKPVEAYVMGDGCSAAYWLASATDRITVDATAIVGSVGVLVSWLDTTAADEMDGVKFEILTNTKSSEKYIDPTTEAGKSNIVSRLDDIAAVFFDAVAGNRGIDVAVIEAWKGNVFVGARAIENQMVDAVGSFENVFNRLKSRGNTIMSEEKAEYTAPVISNIAELADQYPRLAEQIQTEAVIAERQRIMSIMSLSEPGFDDLIQSAIADGISAGDTALQLISEKKSRGVTLQQIQDEGDAARIAPHSDGTQSAAHTPKAWAENFWQARGNI